MARHDTAGIIAELIRSRQVRRSITPEQVDELEQLGHEVFVISPEPDAYGRKICLITRKEVQ